MSNTKNTSTAKKPVFRKMLPGGISAAVFENKHDGRTYRSVNIQRSYRKNNEWIRTSMYLDHEHIPFLIELLQCTWQYLNSTSTTALGDTDTSATAEFDGVPANAQPEEFDA